VDKQWDGTTYGNGLMHRWLIGLLRRIDVRFIYVFAYVFVIPPCLFRPGFKFIYRFFRERFGQSPVRAFWSTYLNHCLFAQVVIDKFAMYAGKKFDVQIEGNEHFLRLAAQEPGFVQLSSHMGNYEIAGYSLEAKSKRFNAIVFYGEKATVMENRNKMFAQTNIRMIPIREDMSHLFEIDRALSDGEIVSIPGDRIWGSPKVLKAEFLGKEARFPMGPFTVAAMRGLDVLAVNVMKVSSKCYRIYVTPLDYDKQAPRRRQTDQLLHNYVAELERLLALYPTQWYNYFDFWKDE
jgi:predicted LPLAT superfamily acyltransferase